MPSAARALAPTPQSQARAYIPTLDGWRAIAIILVISGHCYAMLLNNGSAPARLLAKLVNHAGYGVDIFFALSGFLITTLLLSERRNTGTVNLEAFYLRRFFRIIPAMAVYLIAVSTLGAIGAVHPISPAEAGASVLFFRNYVSGSWYTGHFWSLSIEEHFYAVVPFLVLLLRPRALAVSSIALVGACIGIRAYELAHAGAFMPLPQFRTENRVDALLWGSILAQMCQSPIWRDRLRAWLRPAIVVPAAIGVVALLTLVEDQAFRRTLTAIVLPLLVMSTVLRPADLPGRILEATPLRYVGRLSYSLYIWQMLFVGVSPRTLGAFQDFPLALAMPVLLAILSYRFVEKPSIKVGHAICAARPARPARNTGGPRRDAAAPDQDAILVGALTR